MAFFANTGPNANARLSQLLGQSIGQGAASAVGQGIANQKAFQQQSALANMIFGEGTPQAQQFSQVPLPQQIEYAKLLQPKAPPGGLTGQPVPPEIGKAIADVMNANKNSDSDVLKLALDDAGVPPTYSNPLVENRRRQDEAKAKDRTQKENRYFNTNEPKLIKSAETLKNLKQEAATFDRMNELLQDPSKFPSGITASLFTNEGGLNPKAFALLSPEAQEFSKLIVNSTKNIKDSYGSRITNFDLNLFLQGLPSLLNSPEGKKRVLRDLKVINELNQLYETGIQEVFDDAGGSDKIPFSKAEKIFQDKYGEQINNLLSEFVQPKQNKFKSFPNPKQYLGKRIEDEKTGEIFISDGNEWKPLGK